jgi:hypothetical protein
MPFNIGGVFTGPVPSYGEYSTPINTTSSAPYFTPNPVFTNPTYGVDTTGMSIKTGFEKPSFFDQFSQSFIKNFPDYLGGGQSATSLRPTGGLTPATGDRFAGTDSRVLDLLRKIIGTGSSSPTAGMERGIRLKPRESSIYSGSMD